MLDYLVLPKPFYITYSILFTNGNILFVFNYVNVYVLFYLKNIYAAPFSLLQ